MKRIVFALVLLALAAVAWRLLADDDDGDVYYTGFVEGEERVLRSEVGGRVLEVAFREGDAVPAGAIVARIDDADIAARVRSKRTEIEVLMRQIEQAGHEVTLREGTWKAELGARQAELAQARSEYELAVRSLQREEGLGRTGATTRQLLDEIRTREAAGRSAVDRAERMLARAQAEAAGVDAARARLDVLREQRRLAESQLAELEVTQAKYSIRAPEVPTVVQTQLLWPGELAQPGTPIASVLDPLDKYVQIYVSVSDLPLVPVGRRVWIELDSTPGRRVPGAVSFVADRANFTPEKIETRDDRIGQVYRVKIRILEDVARFVPGTEGNVHLGEGATAVAQPRPAAVQPAPAAVHPPEASPPAAAAPSDDLQAGAADSGERP
ncbi:MAG TPA: HlyD family efflux transporter periplasmic adaptor subunit [Candidatus Limnocylindrales bacterium]|nr:HlyD family efflux transporter periplasmic adaptor subunit [Candidatus Limnocylindrales bacterium]